MNLYIGLDHWGGFRRLFFNNYNVHLLYFGFNVMKSGNKSVYRAHFDSQSCTV